jgi:hypothetical protein
MSTRTLALSMICTRNRPAVVPMEKSLVFTAPESDAYRAAQRVARNVRLVSFWIETTHRKLGVVRSAEHHERIAPDAEAPVQDPAREKRKLCMCLQRDTAGIEDNDIIAAALHFEEINLHLLRRYSVRGPSASPPAVRG